MFNLKGEVVGIVSYILTQSGGFEGIGFVVTSNTVRQALFENPMFWSGLEGILVQGVLAKALNLGYDSGFLIQKVAAGSAAAKLGLRPGIVPVTIQDRTFLLGGYRSDRSRTRRSSPGSTRGAGRSATQANASERTSRTTSVQRHRS